MSVLQQFSNDGAFLFLHSWFSVRSTGTELVLEVQQVGCCYESCLMGDGSSCPNQAYASQWSVYNLVTGKPLLDTAFRNYHWEILTVMVTVTLQFGKVTVF